jgi:regulator of sirC expression with transglutaminase-like and TPR domain
MVDVGDFTRLTQFCMTFATRFTWEKLALELKLLRAEDFGALFTLSIGINSVLWPKDQVESCFRQLQFLGFELMKNCENLNEQERWEALRVFLFDEKGFELTSNRLKDVGDNDLLAKPMLDDRRCHPLPLVFLILHFANFLDLPIALLQARHHFVLKWVRAGKTLYLDLYNGGRPLTDQELIAVLNRTESNLEVWSAKQLLVEYLTLLMHAFESAQGLTELHIVYNLMLQMDETNTTILGQRALLRQKLGFSREAVADLKRYFSFVDQLEAPTELQQAWMELETVPEPPQLAPTDVLH